MATRTFASIAYRDLQPGDYVPGWGTVEAVYLDVITETIGRSDRMVLVVRNPDENRQETYLLSDPNDVFYSVDREVEELQVGPLTISPDGDGVRVTAGEVTYLANGYKLREVLEELGF